MLPVADDELPPTTTSRTSAAAPANTDRVEQRRRRVPASRTPSSVDGDEVGERAGADQPALRPAEARVPAGRGGAQQLGRGVAPALAAHEPLVELDRARLLERLDDRVRVAAERERGAGVAQPRRGSDRRRRGRARSSGTGSSTRRRRRARRVSASVTWVAWTAVKRARQRPGAVEHGGRRRAVAPPGRRRSRRAARRRGRAAAPRGSRPSAATTAALSGSTARTLWIAAPIRRVRSLRERARPARPSAPRHRRRSAPAPRPALGRSRRAGSRCRAGSSAPRLPAPATRLRPSRSDHRTAFRRRVVDVVELADDA